MKKAKFHSAVATMALVAMSFSLFPDTSFALTNIVGNQKYAEDNTTGAWVDLAPLDGGSTDVGVNVSSTTITGKMWSENFGWIEMAPDGGGVTVSDTGGEGVLDGKAWSEHVGWIHFGAWDSDPDSGVVIDIDGYFQGVAWGENFGAIAFGDYMLENSVSNTYTDEQADKTTSWARTSWTPTPLANAAPVANNVAITGFPVNGETLTGHYSYFDSDGDAEGTSTFRWLRSSDEFTGYSATGTTTSTYVLSGADDGMYLKFEVTPVASAGTTTGSAESSGAVHAYGAAASDDHSGMGNYDPGSEGGSAGGGSVTLANGVTNLIFGATDQLDLSGGANTGVANGTTVTGQALTIKAALDALSGGDLQTTADEVTLNSGDTGEDITLRNSADNLQVTIPDGTKVYSDDGWDTTIDPPTDVTGSTTTSGGWVLDGNAVSFGDSGRFLLFNNLVRLELPSAAGQPLYSVNGSNWVEVTTVCDDPDAPTNVSFPEECYIISGTTTIIHTYHATIWADANPTNTTSANLTMTVGDGDLDVDIVDATAATVGSPTTAMTAITTAFVDDTSTGTLGTASEQIYIYNPTATQSWSLTIAPTDGHASAEWIGATDAGDSPCLANQTEVVVDDCRYNMDFNDPAAGAGQFTIDPSGGSLAQVTLNFTTGAFDSEDTSGPAIAGLNLPAAVPFDQGTPADSTLITSTTSAAYRIYRLQGVSLSQVVPAGQPADAYTINFTLTVA